jgi:tetratricopeptide (TPR) repeat protein
MFYAESWALTHMLQLSPEYKQSFGNFFEQIEKGVASQTALESATGKPVAKIQADLAAYMRGNSFFGVNFDAKLTTKLGNQVTIETAPDNDVAVVRAALLATAGHHDEARTVLAEAAARDPKDPALAVASGYRQWRDGKFAEAKEDFKKAFELGTENKRVLNDLARMTAGSDLDLSVSALMRLNKLGSASIDTKLFLGEQLLRQKKYGAAHATLSDIKAVTKTSDAYRISRIRAIAFDSLKAPEDAMKSALETQRYASNELEKGQAQNLIAYLESKQRAAQIKAEIQQNPAFLEAPMESTSGVGVSFIEEDRLDGPVLRRKYIDDKGREVEEKITLTKRSPRGDPMTEVKGKFVALDCKGQQANVVLTLADGKTASFLIKDPNQLVASNKGQGMAIDLTCGPQPPKDVIIWHDPAGVLWQVHFQ